MSRERGRVKEEQIEEGRGSERREGERYKDWRLTDRQSHRNTIEKRL